MQNISMYGKKSLKYEIMASPFNTGVYGKP